MTVAWQTGEPNVKSADKLLSTLLRQSVELNAMSGEAGKAR
jgi:hypothetical protein